MDEQERNKAIVRRYFDVLSLNDIPAMMDLYAEEMRLRVPGETLISGSFGKDDLARFASSVLDAFPQGLRFTVTGLTAEGDRVAVEAFSEGVHASGKPYRNLYHFLVRLRDGRIVESREYMDTQLVTDVICGGRRPGDSSAARRARMSALALEHVRCEDAGDIEGTLATFEDGATFEFFPCGRQLRGRERIRRYYEHFFAVSRPRCTGWRTHGTQEGDEGFGVEMTVTMAGEGAAPRDFRVMTVFRYGETALAGERLFADEDFLRAVFGPLWDETEPLAP